MNKTCTCEPGVCTASDEGKRLGRVSVISDLRCKATLPVVEGSAPLCGCAKGGICRESITGVWVGNCERRAVALSASSTAVDDRHLRIEQDAPVTASMLLAAAESHMGARASAYDKPTGERSMGRTVAAFNEITGRDLLESEGWLLMELLKAVRDYTTPRGHADSQEDRVAYAALAGEARRAGR